jgi:uncharacterized protein DUF3592
VKNLLPGIVLDAGLIVVLAVALRRRYIFRGWQSWPTAEAMVEAAEVRSERGCYFVDIGYSYAVNGSFKTGWDARSFSGQAEAEDYAASIRAQKVVIRFSPKNPECSRIDQEPVSL